MVSTRSAVQAQSLPATAQANSKVLLGKRAPQPKPQRSLWVLLDTVVSHASLLSWLLAAVGLLGLLALPLLERSISFDENALLAGSARPTVRCACSWMWHLLLDLGHTWHAARSAGAVHTRIRFLGMVFEHSSCMLL